MEGGDVSDGTAMRHVAEAVPGGASLDGVRPTRHHRLLLATCAVVAVGGSALIRAAGMMAVTACALVGAGTICVVLCWDQAWPVLPVGDVVSAARAHAPGVLASLALLCAPVLAFSGPAIARPVRVAVAANREGRWVVRVRERAARHEAAHALVASVLGVPFKDVRVLRETDWTGDGTTGFMVATPPPAPRPSAFLHGVLARKIAVLLAGVIGAHDGDGPICFTGGGGAQDLARAETLSWAAADLAPERVLLDEVRAALLPALRSDSWRRAIEAGAGLLLDADGGAVPAGAFARVVRCFGLTLAPVEALAAGAGPDAPKGETA